jgi:hypothetical protein
MGGLDGAEIRVEKQPGNLHGKIEQGRRELEPGDKRQKRRLDGAQSRMPRCSRVTADQAMRVDGGGADQDIGRRMRPRLEGDISSISRL